MFELKNIEVCCWSCPECFWLIFWCLGFSELMDICSCALNVKCLQTLLSSLWHKIVDRGWFRKCYSLFILFAFTIPSTISSDLVSGNGTIKVLLYTCFTLQWYLDKVLCSIFCLLAAAFLVHCRRLSHIASVMFWCEAIHILVPCSVSFILPGWRAKSLFCCLEFLWNATHKNIRHIGLSLVGPFLFVLLFPLCLPSWYKIEDLSCCSEQEQKSVERLFENSEREERKK